MKLKWGWWGGGEKGGLERGLIPSVKDGRISNPPSLIPDHLLRYQIIVSISISISMSISKRGGFGGLGYGWGVRVLDRGLGLRIDGWMGWEGG